MKLEQTFLLRMRWILPCLKERSISAYAANILWRGPLYLDALTRRWPGWQVYGHVEGLVRHVILSGRDAAPLSVSTHRAILELTDELTHDQSTDPLQVSQAIRQALPPEDLPEIRFGTGFFSKDVSPLSPQERRDVLNRLFSGLLEND